MTTNRQLIQTNPGKAGELFAKLADTSGTAVKTRERLFAELKAELDLQAQFEERHLFPLLEKREETRGLVADARDDNRQTRKLLAELERTPKDGEAFLAKAAELRKAFQQHIRDEKKELLPAVAKALSDEEARAAVETIEDGKAGLEASRRAEADEPQAESKGERGEAGAARKAADAATGAARSGADKARTGAHAARGEARDEGRDEGRDETGAAARSSEGETARTGTARRSDAGERSAEAARQAADVSTDAAKAGVEGARQGATVAFASAEAGAEALERAARTAASSGTEEAAHEMVEGTAEIGQSVVALLSEQTRHAMETAAALARARTLAQAAEAQADFIGASFQRAARLNGRYLALARSGMGALSSAARR